MTPTRLITLGTAGALALLVFLKIGIGRVRELSHPAHAEAPGFKLPLLRGGEFELRGDEAAVTVIDFWATWCGPCREELPHVDALHRRYKDRGVRVVAVDAEPIEAKEFASRLAGDLRLELPIALAGDTVAERYHVENLPSVVLIDRTGRVRRVLLGVRSEDELSRLVDEALE